MQYEGYFLLAITGGLHFYILSLLHILKVLDTGRK